MSSSLNTIMVNGEITSNVNVMDRGFQYGDGLFETMQVVNNKTPLWQQHWKRLARGCDALSITPPKKDALEQDIAKLINQVSQGVIKLVVTRGVGGRGYAITNEPGSTVVLILSDYPSYPESYGHEGVQARICRTRLSQQPALAGIKHMNRLEQVLARKEWTDTAISEGIMLDMQGNVIEGTMSNLFMVKGNIVMTPDLNQSGVAGVMRETVLTILSEENIPYEVTTISQDMLASADEVFLTNSVIGLWPVKKIDDTVYSIGGIAREIQQKIKNILKNASSTV